VDDILAAITENGNNIAKLVPIIQERVRQRDQKDVVEENKKAEIAQNNILLIMKNQEDERQIRDQERRRKSSLILTIPQLPMHPRESKLS
jgi:hypothetical protein